MPTTLSTAITHSPKKVLFVMSDYSVLGGIERVTANLMRELSHHGVFEWFIFSRFAKNNTPHTTYPKDIYIKVGQYDELPPYIARYQIDCVVIQTGWVPDDYAVLQCIQGVPVYKIVMIHNSPYLWCQSFGQEGFWGRLKRPLRTRRGKRSLIRTILTADKTLFVSQTAKNEAIQLLGQVGHHADFVYNIVPTDHVARDSTALKHKQKTIVFAGRLAKDKQVLKTVHLLTPLFKKYPEWHYIILGDGEEFLPIRHYLDVHCINNIHLMGAVNNVEVYLQDSTVALLYSLYEGLPTFLLEAMYADNILLASDSKGGVKDIVCDGQNGFVVDSDVALVARCEQIMAMTDTQRASLVSTPTHKAKFDKDRTVAKWLKIFS